MMTFDTNVRIAEMQRSISEMKESINKLMNVVKPEDDLWDNSEIVRRWKISERTLAAWRKKGLISYTQLNGKIWYTREAREKFLREHMVESQRKCGGKNHEGDHILV